MEGLQVFFNAGVLIAGLLFGMMQLSRNGRIEQKADAAAEKSESVPELQEKVNEYREEIIHLKASLSASQETNINMRHSQQGEINTLSRQYALASVKAQEATKLADALQRDVKLLKQQVETLQALWESEKEAKRESDEQLALAAKTIDEQAAIIQAKETELAEAKAQLTEVRRELAEMKAEREISDITDGESTADSHLIDGENAVNTKGE